MMDKKRAEFESCVLPFLIDNGVDTCLALKKNNCGNYELKSIQTRWEGWQASAERYQSRIAELEAEVERLQSDEDRINWLEFEAQDSMSGISAKFMKKQDAHPLKPGYRIYRYHKVHNAAPTLREAIDEAMKGGA